MGRRCKRAVPEPVSSAFLTSHRKTATLSGGQLMSRGAKLVQELVGLALVACTVPPMVEMLLHSDDSIFACGRDIPSTLIFVLLLVELSFAIAGLLAIVLPAVLQRVGVVLPDRLAPRVTFVVPALPTVSPPIPLRI